MSINNREDANKYYQQVNKLVDDYMEGSKIKPSNLKRYLEPGSERFDKFIKRNNLKEVNGIDQVLSDIIEDRVNMERDGVLTFENFNFFESSDFKVSDFKQCLYKGIEMADINMEKVLADRFDTNLGSIDSINSDKHLFKINDWNGKDIDVIIYSLDEVNIILSNIIEFLYDKLKGEDIELLPGFKIKLSFININDFKNSFGAYEERVWDYLSNLLEMELEESDDYFIWVKNS